jgi:two-component system sensor histidine kinase/response regulator
LSKPAPLAVLAATLEKWLPAASSSNMSQDSSSAPVQVSALEALIGTDPRLIRKFLGKFAVNAARLAAELTQACKEGHLHAAAELAHKLKSSSRAVGALQLSELAAAIEAAAIAGDPVLLAQLLPGFEREVAAVDDYLRSLRVAHHEPTEANV